MKLRGVEDLESFRCARHVDGATGEVINYTEVSGLPTGARLTVESGRHGYLAKVEVSVSRYRYGTNIDGLPLAEALEVMEEIHDDLSHSEVTWTLPFAEQRLYRVDGQVDFRGVDEIPVLLRAMERDPSVTRCSNLYNNSGRAGALTLERFTAAYVARLYDKQGEVYTRARRARNPEVRAQASIDGPHATGRLRFEAEMRSGHLKDRGMSTVAKLQADPFHREVERLFNLVGFGREVADIEHVITKLRHAGHSPTIQTGFLGWLSTESAGVDLGLSPGTLSRYRRIARDLNIVPGDLGASYTNRRLDFTSATVVSDAA